MSVPILRWLAAALVLINLAYLWYASNMAEPEPAAPIAALGARQLVLLSELPAQALAEQPVPRAGANSVASQSPTVPGAGVASGSDSDPAENALPQAPLRCWELGPLDASMQADLVGLFERIDIPMRSFEREELDAANYQVYLAIQEPAERAGYQRQLEEVGVESYVIGGGELKGNISLGLFTSRERADAVASPLQELKLPVVIHTRQRRQNRTWLRVDSREVLALGWSADLADLTLWPRPGILAVDCEEDQITDAR